MQTYTIPPEISKEIDTLSGSIHQYQKGIIDSDEIKAYRVPFGIYEQRQRGMYMVRVRCAAGVITPQQLLQVARLAKKYGSGRLHLTTRQEVQIHDINLELTIPVLRGLLQCGLVSRGGGGNTVRNITTSWNSGISYDEVFDVTPHAIALTSQLMALPGSWLLPRKLKIAFSNSLTDNAFATINDLGFIAQMQNGRRGFMVFVAGGMGRAPQPGHLLHDFVPEEEVFLVAESIKRLFSQSGNRRNKHAARLRFLWNALGKDLFIREYQKQRLSIEYEGYTPFVPSIWPDQDCSIDLQPYHKDSPGYELWEKRFVENQRQSGLRVIKVPLFLGDISAEDTMLLAEFLIPFGNDSIRLTLDQNITIRNIPEQYTGNLFSVIKKINSFWNYPTLFGNAIACAGASTCQLGICRSRGALAAIISELQKGDIQLDDLSDFRLHISGCSNSCGKQGLAHLGFFGKVGHKENAIFAAYTVVANAVIDPLHGSRLAQKVGEIAARDMPRFVDLALRHYAQHKDYHVSFTEYFNADGKRALEELCEAYQNVPALSDDPRYYQDWDSDSQFSLEGRGKGECSAGLFDLIDIDINKLQRDCELLALETDSVTKDSILRRMVITSVHALLITRGIESVPDKEMMMAFQRYFIDTGILSCSFQLLLENVLLKPGPILELEEQIHAFSDTVQKLYLSMDDSLQFHVTESDISNEPVVPSIHIAQTKDLRGITCPMNFVNTKMALAQLDSGQILKILLDDGEPILNVPGSVASEGHQILKQERRADHWIVVIQKVA